jgi:signal peptidase
MKLLGTITTSAFFIAFLLLALLLLGSLMPFMGYQIRIVQSGSMAPTMPLGSALIVRSVEGYAVEDVITYQRIGEAEATTHRIIGESPDPDEGVMYITQGDANNVADQRPVAKREIFGKVVYHIPYLGFLLDFIRQPIGFLLVIGIPAAWIVYEQIIRIVREARRHSKKSEEI